MNRGDRRKLIYLDDNDRLCFLETLGQACEKTGWQVHAFCLMRNHFHLLVETPEPNLSAGMKWLLQTYSSRFNRRHEFFGHVFGGRYKAPLIDGRGAGYLRTASDYVHLNPIRARLIKDKQPLSSYRWSSYPLYLKRSRPSWLRVDRVLGECGISGDTAAGRRQFERVMEARRFEADGRRYKDLRRGWMFGSEAFRKELLEQAGKRLGPNHYGKERREIAEAGARQIIARTLRKERLSSEGLRLLSANHRIKVALALRLRRETTMDLKWIARELGIGSWKYLSNLLNREMHTLNRAQLAL